LNRAHNDFTEKSGPERLAAVLGAAPAQQLMDAGWRYAIVQVIRHMSLITKLLNFLFGLILHVMFVIDWPIKVGA
jgi:hypothetical protein